MNENSAIAFAIALLRLIAVLLRLKGGRRKNADDEDSG